MPRAHGTGSFATRSRFNDQRQVLNHMPVQFTEEEATMIDLETPSATDEHAQGAEAGRPRRAPGRRRRGRDRPRGDPRRRPCEPSRPTVPDRHRASDPAAASAVRHTRTSSSLPGTYFVDEVEGVPTPRIFVTLGEGWTNLGEDGLRQCTRISVSLHSAVPTDVSSDACHASDGFHPGPMTTLDGLVAALTEQGGWAK